MLALYLMPWNWEQDEWPNFKWEEQAVTTLEAKFFKNAGELAGLFKHLSNKDKQSAATEIMTDEAVYTSSIEGETLDRASVQSSIARNLGIKSDTSDMPSRERGIATVLTDLHQHFDLPLAHETLFNWHSKLFEINHSITEVGYYRTKAEPMGVLSGRIDKPKIHFVAPPSKHVTEEMNRFIDWFNRTRDDVTPLARAAISHLHFLAIHPFEDGNGRLGRAISEKALSESVGHPAFTLLSRTIELDRKKYYSKLAETNKTLVVDSWVEYFAKLILESQQASVAMFDFVIQKSRLLKNYSEKLNPRQSKVIHKLLDQGPIGFEGGLSAGNYITITGTSKATATRDLDQLVEMTILKKEGQLKSTRYYLNLSQEW